MDLFPPGNTLGDWWSCNLSSCSSWCWTQSVAMNCGTAEHLSSSEHVLWLMLLLCTSSECWTFFCKLHPGRLQTKPENNTKNKYIFVTMLSFWQPLHYAVELIWEWCVYLLLYMWELFFCSRIAELFHSACYGQDWWVIETIERFILGEIWSRKRQSVLAIRQLHDYLFSA